MRLAFGRGCERSSAVVLRTDWRAGTEMHDAVFPDAPTDEAERGQAPHNGRQLLEADIALMESAEHWASRFEVHELIFRHG